LPVATSEKVRYTELMTLTTITAYDQDKLDTQASNLFQDVTLKPLVTEQKIDRFSERFLSREYIINALGEGEAGRFDQGPLFRFDGFDCLTYVNTVLALSLANNVAEFKQNMLKLNYYDADPRYLKRYHFMSLDWNIQNQHADILTDITGTIIDQAGDLIYQTATTEINKQAWLCHRKLSDLRLLPSRQNDVSKLLEQLHHASSQFSRKMISINYLPLSELFTPAGKFHPYIQQQIPNASIIEIVRPGWDLSQSIGTRLHVSHLGFVFHSPQGLIFRHASSEDQHIVQGPLDDYLYQRINSPTIKGINVFVCNAADKSV
jgi:hypothetical protein